MSTWIHHLWAQGFNPFFFFLRGTLDNQHCPDFPHTWARCPGLPLDSFDEAHQSLTGQNITCISHLTWQSISWDLNFQPIATWSWVHTCRFCMQDFISRVGPEDGSGRFWLLLRSSASFHLVLVRSLLTSRLEQYTAMADANAASVHCRSFPCMPIAEYWKSIVWSVLVDRTLDMKPG